MVPKTSLGTTTIGHIHHRFSASNVPPILGQHRSYVQKMKPYTWNVPNAFVLNVNDATSEETNPTIVIVEKDHNKNM